MKWDIYKPTNKKKYGVRVRPEGLPTSVRDARGHSPPGSNAVPGNNRARPRAQFSMLQCAGLRAVTRCGPVHSVRML